MCVRFMRFVRAVCAVCRAVLAGGLCVRFVRFVRSVCARGLCVRFVRAVCARVFGYLLFVCSRVEAAPHRVDRHFMLLDPVSDAQTGHPLM